MHKHIFSFLLLFFAAFSCTNSNVYTDVLVNDQYLLTVPNSLRPCTDLHKRASLQLQNLSEDFYVVVIDEKKLALRDFNLDYNLKTYYDALIRQSFTQKMKYPVIDKHPREIIIGGNKAILSSISGSVNNRAVFYKLGIVETPDYFYQIIVWTRQDKKDKLGIDMQKIIESFKEEKKNN